MKYTMKFMIDRGDCVCHHDNDFSIVCNNCPFEDKVSTEVGKCYDRGIKKYKEKQKKIKAILK